MAYFLFWEHGGKCVAGFIERLNNFLPMTKFTAECCKENIKEIKGK